MARRNAATGQLRWDGERWYWSGEPDRTVHAMSCILDLQSIMLLHLTCERRTGHWLWLEAGNKPERWKALRRAVVASIADTPSEADQEPRDA
jgi:hypothetical protein